MLILKNVQNFIKGKNAPAQHAATQQSANVKLVSDNPTIAREEKFCAQNYHPLPVVLTKGEGVWLWDDQGQKYLDMMSAYSAVSHGHANPRILKAMMAQASKLSVCSRAFHADNLGQFLEKLCAVTKLDMALPMNTGAEAVETAVKAARQWGYVVKKIPENKAEIIVMGGNFHGRTTTVISFSTEAGYRKNFGPFTPGFVPVAYGDIEAVKAAITPNTAAILLEPIQGEAGIVVPPEGFLKELRKICDAQNVLLILDEIQSGLGRTGKMFAFEHEGIRPDGLILGKALGGGVFPVSAFVGTKAVMELFKPGSHGSTFGGNPLAAAIGYEALCSLEEDGLVENSATLGAYMMEQLRGINSPLIREVRGKGLWLGVDFDPEKIAARKVCEVLKTKGVLSKETHETVVRLAPPLVIKKEQVDFALDKIRETLRELQTV
jgi:ornithine--oxo-acid transaminase